MIFVVIILAVILIRLGEFVSYFARMKYFKRNNNSDEKRIKALNLYRVAIKLGGCSHMTKINYAYLALRNGRIDEADRLLTAELRFAKKRPVIVAAKSTLALVRWKQDNIDEAIRLLEEVVAYGANTTAYGSLGYMYNLKGEYDKALEFNKIAFDYAPDNSIIIDNYATSLYKTGNTDEAKRLYKKLCEEGVNFPEAYCTYAEILAEEGNKGAAVAMLKKALDTNFTFLSTLTKENIGRKIESLKGK